MKGRQMQRSRTWMSVASLMTLASCTGGINAGGETAGSNGGIAFIAFAAMLILTCVILYIIMGRD